MLVGGVQRRSACNTLRTCWRSAADIAWGCDRNAVRGGRGRHRRAAMVAYYLERK
jgi:hypothetical protein